MNRRLMVIGVVGSIFLCVGAAGCGDSFRRDLDGGFPNGVGTLGDGNAEGSFRGAMSYYHLSATDIDCMVSEAFANVPEEPSTPIDWSPEQLNEFAATCAIDFSELWYSTD